MKLINVFNFFNICAFLLNIYYLYNEDDIFEVNKYYLKIFIHLILFSLSYSYYYYCKLKHTMYYLISNTNIVIGKDTEVTQNLLFDIHNQLLKNENLKNLNQDLQDQYSNLQDDFDYQNLKIERLENKLDLSNKVKKIFYNNCIRRKKIIENLKYKNNKLRNKLKRKRNEEIQNKNKKPRRSCRKSIPPKRFTIN